MGVVKEIEVVGSSEGKTSMVVEISDCAHLWVHWPPFSARVTVGLSCLGRLAQDSDQTPLESQSSERS